MIRWWRSKWTRSGKERKRKRMLFGFCKSVVLLWWEKSCCDAFVEPGSSLGVSLRLLVWGMRHAGSGIFTLGVGTHMLKILTINHLNWMHLPFKCLNFDGFTNTYFFPLSLVIFGNKIFEDSLPLFVFGQLSRIYACIKSSIWRFSSLTSPNEFEISIFCGSLRLWAL